MSMGMELYFDASVQDYELRIGYVVKEKDVTVTEYGRNTLSAQHSTQGELISLIHALRHLIDEDKTEPVKIYSDSHSVVSMLRNDKAATPSQGDIHQLVSVIRKLLTHFDRSQIYYIDSELNPAHRVAYYAD